MEIKRGDLILVHTSNSIVCWLIRKITQSHWNHVAWYVGDDFVIEAKGGIGISVVPLDDFDLSDEFHFNVVRIKSEFISEDKLDNSVIRAMKCRGRSYDWWLIVQLLFLYVFGLRKKDVADDWDKSWICSELVATPLFECADFWFRDDIPVQNIVPGDISRSGKVFRVKLNNEAPGADLRENMI